MEKVYCLEELNQAEDKNAERVNHFANLPRTADKNRKSYEETAKELATATPQPYRKEDFVRKQAFHTNLIQKTR